jgi:hypothetical protein
MIAGSDVRWQPLKYGPRAHFLVLQRIASFGTGRKPLGGLLVGLPWRHDGRHHGPRHHRWYFLGVAGRHRALMIREGQHRYESLRRIHVRSNIRGPHRWRLGRPGSKFRCTRQA